MVIDPATKTVVSGDMPNITCPILIAAKVTADIAMTLKIIPKYKDRKPLKNAAGFPPYLNS